jgi:hypothetical protein
MTPPGDAPYTLDISGLKRAELRELLVRAAKKGIFAEMREAFERIEARLRTNPFEAGEPLYNLAPPLIAVRKIADRPVVNEYGVMQEQRVVLIREVRSMVDLDP